MNLIKYIFIAAFLSASFSINSFAQSPGSIAGTIVDVNGAIVVGANVTAVGADGKEKTTTSNKNGEFAISGLQPGSYILRVIAPNFALFENPEVVVTAGKKSDLSVTLTIQAVSADVQVGTPDQVSTDPGGRGRDCIKRQGSGSIA